MENERVYCEEFAVADGEAFDTIASLLFAEADEVCLHGEKSDLRDPLTGYADIAELCPFVTHTEQLRRLGKSVLRLHLRPADEVKAFFLRVRTLCARFTESSLRFAPYTHFADTVFLRKGETLVDFTLQGNRIECEPNLAARVAEIYDRCMRRNEEYLAVREKFRTLPPARQRYFLFTGIRLIRNLFLYREKEELIQKKTYDLERMKRLNAYIPRLEWLGVGPYKELIGELFPADFCAQFALDETFADVCNRQRELERVLRKLEFYLVREADTPPMQRTYSS